MTIANSAFAKFAVAFVAIAMMFSVVAAPASAQSTDDMSLEELIALVTQLQSQLGSGDDMMSAGSSADVCPYTWTRTLNMGDTGAEVMALQQFLNSMPETQVAPVGSAGSAGMETQYYGPATGAAVANFQMKYRAEILSPLGLVNPTTFFGNSTRAQANALCISAVVTDGGDDMDDSDDSDDTPGSASLGNDEGSIDAINQNSPDENNVEEGVLSAIYEFELEIEGDIEVDRLDLYMDNVAAQAGAAADSNNADDYFTEAQLWVDGEEVATLDVDDFDEDDYGNVSVVTGAGDEYRLRFSGLGLVFEDGDEPVFVLALVGANNIDTADLDETWGVDMANDSIRFVDGQGFTGTEGDTSVQESFGFDEEEMAEFTITKSSDSEDGRTIEVDDNDTSAEFPIMIVEIEEENDIDAVIDEITMSASSTNTNVTTTIDEVLLVVDGEVIGSDSPAANGDLVFENLDLEISGEETIEIAVHVVFNGTEDYAEGDLAFVTFEAITEAEDENGNDESEITGSNPTDFDSDVFTLRSEGLAITIGSIDEDKDAAAFTGDTDTGTFTFDIDVEAFGEDFFIDEDVAVVNYTLLVDGSAAPAASSTPSITINGADDANSSDFRISRGDSGVSITFTVETDSSVSGSTRVRVDSVDYSAADDGTEELNVLATPVTDWRSGTLILN